MPKTRTDRWYPERVEGGAFVTAPVLQLLRSFEGQQVEVSIRAKRNYVSLPQRGYYHGVVIWMLGDCMREHGTHSPRGGPITDEEVHLMMRGKFLRETVIINEATSEYEEIILSTTEITAGRMTEYIEEIRTWAREIFGLEIPDPNTQQNLRFTR